MKQSSRDDSLIFTDRTFPYCIATLQNKFLERYQGATVVVVTWFAGFIMFHKMSLSNGKYVPSRTDN